MNKQGAILLIVILAVMILQTVMLEFSYQRIGTIEDKLSLMNERAEYHYFKVNDRLLWRFPAEVRVDTLRIIEEGEEF